MKKKRERKILKRRNKTKLKIKQDVGVTLKERRSKKKMKNSRL